jgi:membrane-bound lytic murein transglycosylase D
MVSIIRHLFTAVLYVTLFFVSTDVAKANSWSSQLFPLPESIKPNVEFWIKIYSKYSERAVVIHDAEDLSIIYDVVNLDSLFKGLQVSERLQWKKIERIKKEIKSTLLRLSYRKRLNWASLTEKEKYVAKFFREKWTAKRLRKAAYNIRAQNGLKERFKKGLKRSGLYMEKMRQIIYEAGLPEELLVLPHVESSFNYRAYSKFGAAGIWQFTRSTGRRFLKINYDVDERLDPILSTEAAIKLLKHNYKELGTWPLAITAYNHGLNGMKKAKKRYGSDITKIIKYYNSRSFGFASRNFYAEFLAALHVVKNYQTYFGEIDFHKPADYVVFDIPHYISVNTLIEKLDIEFEEFAKFNPALRSPVLRSKRRIPKNFRIRVPMRENLNITELYAKISPNLKFNKQIKPEWHKVRTGETLSSIARKYRVSLGELLAYNDINNAHLIYAGQKLRIPKGQESKVEIVQASAKPSKEVQLAEASELGTSEKSSVLDIPKSLRFETISKNKAKIADKKKLSETESERAGLSSKKGDIEDVSVKRKSTSVSLGEEDKGLKPVEVKIAEERYASLEEEMAMALPDYYVEMTKTMTTRIVRTPHKETAAILFRQIDLPENGQIKVEPEETLGHYADWLEVPTQKLRAINGLSYWEPIQIGQAIWLTFERVTPEEFHRRRLEYHQGIEEDFYNNYNIEGDQTYKVRPGENIWIISNRRFEVPYWLIKKYNPDQDLFNLFAGQEIVIPIVVAKNPEEMLDN